MGHRCGRRPCTTTRIPQEPNIWFAVTTAAIQPELLLAADEAGIAVPSLFLSMADAALALALAITP